MKKLLLHLSGWILMLGLSQPIFGQGVPELMYYKFDGTGLSVPNNASSPVGTNPTNIVSTTQGGVGQFGGALLGNASGNLPTGWNTNLGTGSWTISFWYNHGAVGTGSADYIFGDAGATSFRCFANGAVGIGNIVLRGGGLTDIIALGSADPTNHVIHFVHNATAGTINSYVDGVLSSSTTQTPNIPLGTGLIVGGYTSAMVAGARLDEFRIYNRALTQAEITLTYNAQLPMVTAPNNAYMESFVTPVSACPGITPITVKVQNYGNNILNSFVVNTTVFDGTSTTTLPAVSITGANLDSLNGTGIKTMNVVAGNFNFQAGLTYNIKSWTSLPNGVADSDPTNDTIFKNGFKTSMSGTYTVGPGKTYTTILAAISDLNSYGVCGPVIFDVTGTATFTNQLEMGNINGASATNTITFRGHGATISVAASASNYAIWRLNGSKYVTIDSFRVVSNDPTYGWGFHLLNQADYNTISNCYIDMTALTSTLTSNGAGIISTSTNTSYTGYANNANYCKFIGNTIKGGPVGLYNMITLNGTSTTVACVGNQVINNKLIDGYVFTIRSMYQEDGIISGNEISQPTKTGFSTFYGVYIYYNRGMVVNRNKIFNVFLAGPNTNAVYPIYNYYNNSTPAKPTLISNNLISDIYSTGTIYAIYHTAGSSNYYYHNTVSLDWAGATAGSFRGVYQTTASTDLEFRNNIFTITQGGSGIKHGLYFATNTTVFNSNNNVIYMNSLGSGAQYTGYWNAVNYATLANWQTAGTATWDLNSVSADPVYALPGNINYQPGSPSVNNIGAPIASVTTDINNAPRSPFNPDPGAYEFTPANDDAGIIAITGLTAKCPGNTLVKADIKNFGVASLFSATVQWKVNGVLQPNATFIGSLGTGLTAQINLGNLNLLNGVTYNVEAWTTQPNGNADGNTINDTNKVLGVQTSMSGIYTVGPAGNFVDLAAAATALGQRGVCSPVVLNMTPGTYNTQVVFNSIPGASATNTITVNGRNSTISVAPSAAAPAIVRFNGAKYVTIDSLNLVGTSIDYGWGIHMMNSSNYNTIKNCNINLTALTNIGTANGVGIALSGSTTSPTTSGDNANNCLLMNNKIKGGSTGLYYGIVLYGNTNSTGVSDNQFIGNIIEDVYTYNFYAVYAANTVVRGNDISRANKVTVNTFYGIVMSTGCIGTLVEKNRIHNTHDVASTLTGTLYLLYHASDGSPSAPNVMSNNMVYNINGTGTIYGIYSVGADNSRFYYNTLSLDHTAATAGIVYAIYQTTAATGVEFRNNLVSITRGGSGVKYGLYYSTNTSTITSNNNLVYMGSAGTGLQYVGRWGTLDFAGMTAWRNGSTFDMNSDSLNPNFLDKVNNDLTPNTFSGNNIALPISGITTDFNGVTRNATTPDPGALEFTPIPTNDSCHQAITVGAGATLGSTTSATLDIAPTCGVSDGGSGVWYKYVASGDFVRWSLCGSTFDTRIRVFEGSCGSFTCVAGNEDFCSAQSEVSGCTKNGVTYYVLVHGNGSANGEFTLTITETPVQQATITSPSNAFCPGDSVLLTAGSASGYLWNNTAASTSQSIYVSTIGAYNVVITDANGCKDTSNNVNIAQHNVVVPNVTTIGNTSFCEGDSVILTSDTRTSYQWNDASMSTTKSIIVDTTGSFMVTTVDNNGCTSSSAAINTTVFPLPEVDLGNDTTICSTQVLSLDAGNGFSNYFWSTGATSQTINFTASPGTHTINVTITDANGCQGNDQIDVTIVICTGIEEVNATSSVVVFPNPGTGLFNVAVSGFEGDLLQLNVVDYSGRLVHTGKLTNNNGVNQTVDLSQLASGIYTMTVLGDNEVQTVRLMIK